MARQKGSANFAGTLEVLAGGPIDSRSIVPTLADLTVASNFPYPYQYMEVRVTATGKKYKLVGNDLTVAANWVEIEETGGSQITVDSALSTTSENPVQNKVITTEINKKANATALDSKADLVDGKVPASQLPSASYTAGDGIDISNDEISIDPMPATDMEEIMTPLPSVMPRHFGPGGGFAPVGTVISFMGVNPPQDYLACDGTVYNIANYPQLAKFFEDQFGSKNYFGGNGTTTFAVPDLRGEFLRGTGTNGHANQGNGGNVGAHQDATEFPDYEDVYTINGKMQIARDARLNASHKIDSKINTSPTIDQINIGGNYTASSNIYGFATARPTNTSILWCIKAIEDGEKYSTTERKIGTWIDGKPVYQKTITILPSQMPQVTTDDVKATVDLDIGLTQNNENIIDIKAVRIPLTSSKNRRIIPVIDNGKISLNLYISSINYLAIESWKTSNNIVSIVVTIQYTKTTD